jgi:hypothetical protein
MINPRFTSRSNEITMPSFSNKAESESQSQSIGDTGNKLLVTLTILISFLMLYQWPSPTYFDSNWLANGFCVSNTESFLLNSHMLSFYADLVLSAILGYLFLTHKKKTPPLQEALLRGAVTGVFGHGLGHCYLALEPTGMDLRLKLDDIPGSMPMNMVSLCAFAAIFGAAMPLASFERLAITSFLSTAGFTLLDVPPRWNFVYAQAAIYVASAIHMLSLDPKYKMETSYMLYPWCQLPVLAVGVLESTFCQQLLEPIGGHMVFDTTIAFAVIAIELMSRTDSDAKRKDA